MDGVLMELKIFLPFRVFAEIGQVKRIVAETNDGSFGILPQRLDCVAAVQAGIFTYETETDGIRYLATDKGILVKAGSRVMLSVRNAFGDADLGKLRELVEKEFLQTGVQEKSIRDIAVRLESGFLTHWEKLRKQ